MGTVFPQQHAHEEFGAEFDAQFSYCRGGEEYVMMKSSSIAKRYTELTGRDAVS